MSDMLGKARFRRRTFHEPNLIRISKADQGVDLNYLDWLTYSDADLNPSRTKRRKMLILVKLPAKYAVVIDALDRH